MINHFPTSFYSSKEKSLMENDTALWKEFKNGSELAYASIYKKYITALYNYGIKIIGDKEIVKDTIQDLFVEIWRNKENLNDTNNIKFYLFKSLRRKIIRSISSKRIRLHQEIDENYSFEVTSSFEANIIIEEVKFENKNKIEISLKKLSKRQREAIFLRFYENLHYDDIASVMSISSQSVYNLIFQSLRLLKSHIYSIFFILNTFHLF
ncbi:sigma-70 family RNA polymerase sigma factor [soil metagenome]